MMKFRSWTFPLVLLVLCVVAFGLFIPFIGFYWDDWAKILVSPVYGLSGYWDYYAEDRPLSGWTHVLLTPLLGHSPLPWQIFTLGLRWLTAWGMWWCLSTLWPGARRASAYAAALFVVYPVFTLQPIAVTFHQQWLQYALFVFSAGAMLKAARDPRRYWQWTGAALAASLLQLSVTEYFVGNELLRPVMLLILACQLETSWRRRFLTLLRQYAPYALLLGVYLAWRFFFIRLSGDDPYQAVTLAGLLQQPVETLVGLFKTMVRDTHATLVASWLALLEIRRETLSIPLLLGFTGAAVVSAAALVVYFLRLDDGETRTETEPSGWVLQAAALGLLATLAGMLPAWATGRDVLDGFHANRYALPAMFGASLLFASLLVWIAQRRLQQAVLLGVLVALALGMHLRTGNEFRWNWTEQQRFYWQLAWRAPALQPDTAIVLEEEPIPDQGLFSTSAALNLLYPQPEEHPTLAYWVYTLLPRYAGGVPADLKIHFQSRFRTLSFKSDAPASILVETRPARGNCLWVLDATYQDDPYLSDRMRAYLPASSLGRIGNRPAAGYPPRDFFGKEPERSWCYFFEKGDLARQLGDWTQAAGLADQAIERGYQPSTQGANSPHEWVPFIEAYAHEERWEEARDLTLASFAADQNYGGSLCRLWSRIGEETPAGPAQEAARDSVRAQLGCTS